MRGAQIIRLIIILGIYLGFKYLLPFGAMVLYPINLLVTFLHEFGHGLGAIITGGEVLRVQINADGSGFTETMGGFQPVILMGGYIGSALFGNLLFYIGVQKPEWAKPTAYILATLMALTGIWWFNSLFTSGVLFLFAFLLVVIARNTEYMGEILMFLGLASLFHIIEDFNVGPTSDLQQYATQIPILPASAWMYVWLGIVLLMTFQNFKKILTNK